MKNATTAQVLTALAVGDVVDKILTEVKTAVAGEITVEIKDVSTFSTDTPIDIRTADNRFVLDQLNGLTRIEPSSPLSGHLDLQHVGIVGHSIGGATAIQVMAADPRFKVGVNLDGKLFGTQPDARLHQPLLWMDGVDEDAVRIRTQSEPAALTGRAS